MNPKIILIADDHPHILKLIEYTLEEIECWIETAKSGEEAVTKSNRMHIDLLVIDVKLPGIDGFEAVRQIKSREGHENIPVIVLKGEGHDELRSLASTLGVSAFLTKPFSPNELAATARRLSAA